MWALLPGVGPLRGLHKKSPLTFPRCVILDAQRQQAVSELKTDLRQGRYRPRTGLLAIMCFQLEILRFRPLCVVALVSGFVGHTMQAPPEFVRASMWLFSSVGLWF